MGPTDLGPSDDEPPSQGGPSQYLIRRGRFLNPERADAGCGLGPRVLRMLVRRGPAVRLLAAAGAPGHEPRPPGQPPGSGGIDPYPGWRRRLGPDVPRLGPPRTPGVGCPVRGLPAAPSPGGRARPDLRAALLARPDALGLGPFPALLLWAARGGHDAAIHRPARAGVPGGLGTDGGVRLLPGGHGT